MQIGIFSKTFARPTLAGVLDAVAAHGLQHVQFNLDCAGLEPMPDVIDDATCDVIRQALAARGIEMAAISGTFNMIHPDLYQRQLGLQRLRTLAAACKRLGTHVITLCTGTRDPVSMWRRHPDNDSAEAWQEMLASMYVAAEIAAEFNVTMGFEPEVSNVVDSARKGRRLLDTIQSPHLKVVMDGANVFHAGELSKMHAVLDETFDLLGNDIVLAHAKDISQDGEAGHDAAGTGLLDYDYYLALLQRAGYTGPLILHSLSEAQVDDSVAFLRGKLAGRQVNR